MRRSVIIGTGSYIPERRVSNEEFMKNRFFMDYGEPLQVADNPRTVSRFQEITDIGERRWAADDQVASDLGLLAAEKALESAGVDRESERADDAEACELGAPAKAVEGVACHDWVATDCKSR